MTARDLDFLQWAVIHRPYSLDVLAVQESSR